MTGKEIESIEQLRRRVPAILEQLNADQDMLQAAAANPLFALEELGYRVPEALRRELEHRIRFPPAQRERLEQLRSRIFRIAGEPFDLDDPIVLEDVLFKHLKLPPLPALPIRVQIAAGTKAAGPRMPAPSLAVHYRVPGTPVQPDVLSPLEGTHPIVEPLIAYRQIAASQAPFAPRELYERARRGKLQGPKFKLRARLQKAQGR